MKWFLFLMAMFAMTASAADISGKWKGTAETPNGTIERSFDFKQDGSTLTGETNSSRFGTSKIEDGKVEGESVTFHLTVKVGGQEGKVNYNGKIDGDTIKFQVEIQAVGQTIEFIAKRVP